jgi:hypothetical protein
LLLAASGFSWGLRPAASGWTYNSQQRRRPNNGGAIGRINLPSVSTYALFLFPVLSLSAARLERRTAAADEKLSRSTARSNPLSPPGVRPVTSSFTVAPFFFAQVCHGCS